MKTNSACYSARRRKRKKKEKDNQKKKKNGIPTAAQEFEKYCSFRLARMCVQNKLCKKTRKKTKQNEQRRQIFFSVLLMTIKQRQHVHLIGIRTNCSKHALLHTKERERKKNERKKKKKLRISLILKHTHTHRFHSFNNMFPVRPNHLDSYV